MFIPGQNRGRVPGIKIAAGTVPSPGKGLGLGFEQFKHGYNRMFSGKPLVFRKHFHNENKSNKKLFSILYFLLPFFVTSGHLSQVTEMSTPENSGTVLSLPLAFVSLHFVSIDLGPAAHKLAKFFFGGYFFLPAALKLPVITGLSDYQKL